MSSESLGGRGDRALLSSTVTTIFCILKNMIDSGESFPPPLEKKIKEPTFSILIQQKKREKI